MQLCRLLWPVFLLLLLVPPAHAGEFASAKQLVGFYDSEASVGLSQMPLAPKPGSTTATGRFLVRQVGPIDVGAGDCLDVRAREQFSNSNSANGWWTIGGVQSEHWFLWVGSNIGIRYTTGGPPANPDSGTVYRRETGENWDWLIHHWQWDASEMQCFSSAADDLYLFTTVWWVSSASYRQSSNQYVVNDERGKLEVLHFASP